MCDITVQMKALTQKLAIKKKIKNIKLMIYKISVKKNLLRGITLAVLVVKTFFTSSIQGRGDNVKRNAFFIYFINLFQLIFCPLINLLSMHANTKHTESVAARK